MRTIDNVREWFNNRFIWRTPREKARVAYERVCEEIDGFVDFCIHEKGVKPYNIYVLLNLKTHTIEYSVNGAKRGTTNYQGLFNDMHMRDENDVETFNRELNGRLIDRYNAVRTTNGVNYRLVA